MNESTEFDDIILVIWEATSPFLPPRTYLRSIALPPAATTMLMSPSIRRRSNMDAKTEYNSDSSVLDVERGVSLTDPENEPTTRDLRRRHRAALIPALILLLGGVASGVILIFGVPAAQSDQTKQFQRLS
jgi:hypothetical protein